MNERKTAESPETVTLRPDRGRSRIHDLALLLIATLPWIAGFLCKAILDPRPLWAFYFDPETLYFYDGLRLLSGTAVHNVDNPGTPLQILSALLASVTGRTPLAIDTFRSVGYALILTLKLVAAWALLRTILRSVVPILAIVAIWSYLIAPQALEYDTVWSPEAFYFPVGSLAAIALWNYARDSKESSSTSVRAFLCGAAIGLCIALKFTLLAWLPALLMTLLLAAQIPNQRWRDAGLALAGAVAAFFLATLPAAGKYPQMWSWLIRLATRSGAYGSGAASVPGIDEISGSLGRTLALWPQWYLWLGIAAILAFLRIRRSSENERALFAFAVFSTLFQYILLARHFTPRYGLAAGIGALLLTAIAFRTPWLERSRAACWAVFLVAGVMVFSVVRGDLAGHTSRIRNVEELRMQTQWVIRKEGLRDPVIVYSWRFPEPSFALRALAHDERFLREIETLFPNDGHYDSPRQENVPNRKLHLPHGKLRWDYFVLDRKDVRASPANGGRALAVVGSYVVVGAPRVTSP